MTQQQQPSIIVAGKPCTNEEAATALLRLLNSDENAMLKFTNEVLAIRNIALEQRLAATEPNGTSDEPVPEEATVAAQREGQEG